MSNNAVKSKMTVVCESAENDLEHEECHASTCQCPCHNGLGGICDCDEVEALYEAERLAAAKAYWFQLIGAEIAEKIKNLPRVELIGNVDTVLCEDAIKVALGTYKK